MVSETCDRKISFNDENNYHKSQHHYTAEPVMAEPTAVDFGSCRYMLQCSLKQKNITELDVYEFLFSIKLLIKKYEFQCLTILFIELFTDGD